MKNNKFYNFRWKILIGMLMVAVIPMLIGYILMLQVFHLSYEKNFNGEAESTLAATEEAMDSAFLNIYEGIDKLCSNEAVHNYFGRNLEDDRYEVVRQVYMVNSKCNGYANFSLYDVAGNRLMTGINNRYIKDQLPLDWGILYEASKDITKCIVRNAHIYNEKEEYLRAAKAVTDESDHILGYVVAVVLSSNFNEILQGIGIENQGVIYIVDDFYETVYCSQQLYNGNEQRMVRKHIKELEKADNTRFKSYNSTNGEYRYYETFNERCQLHIYYQQHIATLNAMKNKLVTIAIISEIVTLVFCLVLSGYFSDYIYRPIKKLKKAMKEVKKGNYRVKLEEDSEDELGELSRQFNKMSEALDYKMSELVLRERELSETQIKMLQAQLNPHFLYNTLDTMKWIGKVNHLPEVVTLSTGLAKIFRMSISSGQMITLSDELNLVEAYVEIQKIRFADKFEFLIDIPKDLKECMVPKMILQPLVENAILHGLKECDHGMVMIQGYETGEQHLKLIVKDDGKGISKKDLDQIKQKSGIGIYNVDTTIKLRYGQQYGLTVDSQEGNGTNISILLPILQEDSCEKRF